MLPEMPPSFQEALVVFDLGRLTCYDGWKEINSL